jgi:ribonuclease HII
MDEAGRGPICGPVCVAGVILEKGYENPDINDSKKLSEKKREKLALQILQDAKAYWVVMIDEETIDTLNIYRAVQKGMNDIAKKALEKGAQFVISDAMPLEENIPHEAVVHGDAKSISVAAASILAKVFRDHYMYALDALYPQYGLKDHKGYPTKKHLAALDAYGLQSFYRKSYRPVYERMQKSMRLF